MYKQHQIWKPTLWHWIIYHFYSSGIIWCEVIHVESLSSIPDVSQYPYESLRSGRSGNHRKSLEVLTFYFHASFLVRTSNKSTARGTNACHFLGICDYCCFHQDGGTVHTWHHDQGQKLAEEQVRGKSSAAWPSNRGGPGVRTCPPWPSGSEAWPWQSSKEDPPPGLENWPLSGPVSPRRSILRSELPPSRPQPLIPGASGRREPQVRCKLNA